MSVKEFQVGDLVLVTPLLFEQSNTQYGYTKKVRTRELAVITGIEDTLDVWYHKQDKFKHTYTVLTTYGEIKKFFKHEVEPVENTKYYVERGKSKE